MATYPRFMICTNLESGNEQTYRTLDTTCSNFSPTRQNNQTSVKFLFKDITLMNTHTHTHMSLYIYRYRVLHSIFAVPRTVFFWTEVLDVFPGICCSQSPSLGVTAPSSPITTGITVSFPFSSSSLGISHVSQAPSSWCCCHLVISTFITMTVFLYFSTSAMFCDQLVRQDLEAPRDLG